MKISGVRRGPKLKTQSLHIIVPCPFATPSGGSMINVACNTRRKEADVSWPLGLVPVRHFLIIYFISKNYGDAVAATNISRKTFPINPILGAGVIFPHKYARTLGIAECGTKERYPFVRYRKLLQTECR
jgi:hypothetical protein